MKGKKPLPPEPVISFIQDISFPSAILIQLSKRWPTTLTMKQPSPCGCLTQ
jgi:hypothetical protein